MLRVDCPLKPNSGIKCQCITPDDFNMQPGGPRHHIAYLLNNRDTHCACWAPAAHVSFCKSWGPTSLSTDKLTVYWKHLWAAALIAVTKSVFSSAVAGYCAEFACFWQRRSSFSCYQNEICKVNAPYPDLEQFYKTDVNSKCLNLLIKWRLKKVKIIWTWLSSRDMFKQLKYTTNNFKVKYEFYKRSQTSGKKVTGDFFWLKIKSRSFKIYLFLIIIFLKRR